MRRWKIVSCLSCALGLAPACANDDLATEELALAGGVQSTGETPLLVMSGDPDRNLFVTTGVSAAQAPAICLGWPDEIESVGYHSVALASGAFVERYAGEATTLVWTGRQPWTWTADFGSFFDAFCDAVVETAPIASGRASMMLVANNWGGDLPQGWHWGLKARGWLTGADGAPIHFTHTGECSVTPGADGTFRCNTNVVLP